MDGSQPARPSPLAWTRIASLNSNASTLQHLVNQVCDQQISGARCRSAAAPPPPARLFTAASASTQACSAHGEAAAAPVVVCCPLCPLQGKFSVLDPEDVRHSIRCHMLEQHAGGEAEVCIVTWAPVGSQGSQAIPPGTRVAVKLYHRSNGGNGFLPIRDEFDRIQEGRQATSAARHCSAWRRRMACMHNALHADKPQPILGALPSACLQWLRA